MIVREQAHDRVVGGHAHDRMVDGARMGDLGRGAGLRLGGVRMACWQPAVTPCSVTVRRADALRRRLTTLAARCSASVR